MIEIYVCTECHSYCDEDSCFACDAEAVLTQRESTMEQDLALLKQTFGHTEEVDVYLSSFGDAPSEIATVQYRTDALFSLLQQHPFVFNDISSILTRGVWRKGVGVALLQPLDFQHENIKDPSEIFGLVILH